MSYAENFNGSPYWDIEMYARACEHEDGLSGYFDEIKQKCDSSECTPEDQLELARLCRSGVGCFQNRELGNALRKSACESGCVAAIMDEAAENLIWNCDGLKNADKLLAGIKKMAEKGDARACYYLGMIYFEGYLADKPESEKKSDEWLRKSYQLGDRLAALNLGRNFFVRYCEVGTPSCFDESEKWLIAAGNIGKGMSYYILGLLNLRVPDDDEGTHWLAACRYFEIAEKFEMAEAYFAHGDIMRRCRHSQRDIAKARELYEKSCLMGYQPAKLELGKLKLRSLDASERRSGMRLIRNAANQGEAEAMIILADLYSSGMEEDPEGKKAQNWYQKAKEILDPMAEEGYPRQVYLKAKLLLDGIFPDTEEIPADCLLEEAALSGVEDALYLSAKLQLESGIPDPDGLAAQRMLEAAELGVPEAMYEAAVLYRKGKFLEKNLKESAVWLARAAEAGDMRAIRESNLKLEL